VEERAPGQERAPGPPRRWAAGFLLAGFAALVAYYLVADELQDAVYHAIALACVVALTVRSWIAGSRDRGAWLLLGVGVLLWLVGDLVLTALETSQGGTAPFPSYAHAIYLAGYPAIAIAAMHASRLRAHPQDRGAGLEALMVTLAVAVPVYAFWIAPALADSGQSTSAAVVSTAYPVMDLLLIAVGVRLALGIRHWSVAALLLAAGLGANVLADVGYNVQILAGTYTSPAPIDAGWLISYLCWGAAALHPSAGSILEPAREPSRPTARSRAMLLSLIVVPPLTVVGTSYTFGTELDAGAVLGALVAISIVMIVRLRDIARTGSSPWRPTGLLYSVAFVVLVSAVGLTQIHAEGQQRVAAIQSLLRADA